MNLRGGWLDQCAQCFTPKCYRFLLNIVVAHVYNQHSSWFFSPPPPKKKNGHNCKRLQNSPCLWPQKHHLKHQDESHSGSVNGGPNYCCLPCIAIACWRRLAMNPILHPVGVSSTLHREEQRLVDYKMARFGSKSPGCSMAKNH